MADFGEPTGQSTIGKISLVSSIAGLGMIIGAIPLMTYLDRAKPELRHWVQSLDTPYLLVAALLGLFSTASGIAGLFSKKHRKDFAVGGLLMGIGIIFMLVMIFLLPFIHPHASSRS